MASRAATGRAIAIVLALVLALVGAFLIWRYVSQADQRAFEGAQMVDVFVATDNIPQGMTANTAVSQDLIEADQLPQANLPPSPVASLQDISGLAATGPIFEGTVLLQPQWGDPTLVTSDLDIPPEMVAMSLQVGVPAGVSGHVIPGDEIAIIGHLTIEAPTTQVIGPDGNVIAQAPAEGEQEAVSQSRFVASNVEVLSVGQRVIVENQEGEETGEIQQTEQVLLTLALTPEDAERLSFTNFEAAMYFTLLPDDFVMPETSGQTADTLFPQSP